MSIAEQAEQLRPRQLGAALVFQIRAGDLHTALGGERLDLGAGPAGVLFVGRGSEIGANEAHWETLRFNKLVSILSVCFGPSIDFVNYLLGWFRMGIPELNHRI